MYAYILLGVLKFWPVCLASHLDEDPIGETGLPSALCLCVLDPGPPNKLYPGIGPDLVLDALATASSSALPLLPVDPDLDINCVPGLEIDGSDTVITGIGASKAAFSIRSRVGDTGESKPSTTYNTGPIMT